MLNSLKQVDSLNRCKFEPKSEASFEIKQELTTLKFNNLYAFRKNRSEPEVFENYLVSEACEGDASLRIVIPHVPTMVAGEIPHSDFAKAKFQQDVDNPTNVTLVLDDVTAISGTNALSARTSWRFVKMKQDGGMLASLSEGTKIHRIRSAKS